MGGAADDKLLTMIDDKLLTTIDDKERRDERDGRWVDDRTFDDDKLGEGTPNGREE
uniref:Uncharacterized protein n=1 Tax=Cucumis melo TaxID=3656 RepID=A0A9I9CXU6_CUCME